VLDLPTSPSPAPVPAPAHGAAWPAAVGRFDRALCAANRWLLVGLLAVMAALVIANVFSRYAFGHSFSWVEEATRYMMIWATFLGAGPALRVGGHIAIDSLPAALPAPAARCLRALVVTVIAVTLVAMVWLGWDYASFAWEQESPVLGWSLGRVYLALPLGAALMLLHLAMVARRWVGVGEWERVEGFDPQAL
jgi:TRAP-type C4-dicarboxylate transport system permease small subunit